MLTTFTLPFLSRYTFNLHGECYSNGNQVSSVKGRGYNLWNDQHKREHVTISEIIAYGKHIQSLNEYSSGGIELRLPSKINKL